METTGITWADATANGWWGCTEVGDGCANCYARDFAGWTRGLEWGKGAPRVKVKSIRGILNKIQKRADTSPRPLRVFSNSMSDLFDKEVDDAWKIEFIQMLMELRNVHFLWLTKRPTEPERFAKYYDPERVWLGTSLASQKDVPLAKKIVNAPARVHWVSYEPAIGPLNLYALPDKIKWVVVGGESGPNARPFKLEWTEDTIRQGDHLGIKVFVKQLGARPTYLGRPFPISDTHGAKLEEWPEHLRVQEFPENN